MVVLLFIGCHTTAMGGLMNLVLVVKVDQATEARIEDESYQASEMMKRFTDARFEKWSALTRVSLSVLLQTQASIAKVSR